MNHTSETRTLRLNATELLEIERALSVRRSFYFGKIEEAEEGGASPLVIDGLTDKLNETDDVLVKVSRALNSIINPTA